MICWQQGCIAHPYERKTLMTAAEEHARLAEGAYSYTLDDRPYATELWRLNRLTDDRLHLQTLLGVEKRVLYAMDLVIGANGMAESLEARLSSPKGDQQATLNFSPGGISGQVQRPEGVTPVQLAAAPQTLPLPESIATRFVVGRALDLASDHEQTLSLCLVPVFSGGQPLTPQIVTARATVMGPESVDLLMATVTATRVLIEWPNHPPQHGWFDERRFPVQWYWVGRQEDGASVAHEYSLTRYAWHAE
jgi:hypothetical protein